MITQELQLDKQHQYYKSRKRNRVERNKKYKGRDTARSSKSLPTRNRTQRDKDFLDDLYI